MTVFRPTYDGLLGQIETEGALLVCELDEPEYVERKKVYSKVINLINEYTNKMILRQRKNSYCVKTYNVLKFVCFSEINDICKRNQNDGEIEHILIKYFSFIDHECDFYSNFDGTVGVLKMLFGAGFSHDSMEESLGKLGECDSDQIDELDDQLAKMQNFFTEEGRNTDVDNYKFTVKKCNKADIKAFEKLMGKSLEELQM